MAKKIKEADETVKFGDEVEKDDAKVNEAKKKKIKESDEDGDEKKVNESKRSATFRQFLKEALEAGKDLDEDDDEDAKKNESEDEEKVNEEDEGDEKKVDESKKGKRGKGLKEDEEGDEKNESEDDEKVNEDEDEDAKKNESEDDEAKNESEDDEKVNEEDEAEKELDEARKAIPVLSEAEIAQHVNVLFEGAQLSDDFRTKAATILESAVNTSLAEQSKKLNEANDAFLAKKTALLESKMVKSVDNYLTEAAKQWIAENRLQVERGLMLEQSQSFISGLRQLMLEHNINVPVGQENLVEMQAAKIERLTNRLNEEIEARLTVTKSLNEAKKEIALNKLTEGLSVIDKEKVVKLAEGLDGSLDAKAFETKVKVLKESYVSKAAPGAKPLNESVGAAGTHEQNGVDPLVAKTLAALSKKH